MRLYIKDEIVVHHCPHLAKKRWKLLGTNTDNGRDVYYVRYGKNLLLLYEGEVEWLGNQR